MVEYRDRRAPWDYSLEVGPPPPDPPTVALEEVFEWDGHFFLDHNGVVDVSVGVGGWVGGWVEEKEAV